MLSLIKKIGALTTAGVFVLSGCSISKPTSNEETELNINEETTVIAENFELVIPSENTSYYEEYELGVAMGKRMKTIIDNKELDETVIVVNGRSIARRDIESAKVYVEFNFGEENLKDRLNNLITDAVLETEAEYLGVKGSQDDVDAYISLVKESGFPPFIVGYIEGLEVTTDEYYEILEDMMYNSTVRNNVWLKYREEQADKMQNEAEEKNASFEEIEKEYREKYELQLTKKADIEIIDTEAITLIGN